MEKEINSNLSKEDITKIKNGQNLTEEIKGKLENIVFAQIFPMSNNMIDFGLDINAVKDIILPFIEQYKLPDDQKEIILSEINNKIK